MPEISIIVPVYNVKPMLTYCIKSIIGQSYGDFEVLLIDDGSTDGSSELCDELGKLDARISVFHKENGGLSDARNYGLDRASGKFYLFIDSDDVIHKDFCRTMIDLQKKYNSDIVSVKIVSFFSHNEIPSLDELKVSPEIFCYKGNDILKQYFTPNYGLGGGGIYTGMCMKIYKRELFNGLRFEYGRLHEDLFITYKILDRAETFINTNYPYYYYGNNPNSITRNYREKNFIDEHDAFRGMLEYFHDRPEIQQELNYFIMNAYVYRWSVSTRKLPRNPEISERQKEIRSWIISHLDNKYISRFTASKIFVKTKFPRAYHCYYIVKNMLT